METVIEPHNQKPAAVWNCGGARYDDISRGIADSIEHCVQRLNPQPGDRVLDLATGTGWTSRAVARRGAKVTGVDLGADLIMAAGERAKAEGLDIEYQVGDAEKLPFPDGAFAAVIINLRRNVCEPARGRGCRARPRLPQGWKNWPHNLAV